MSSASNFLELISESPGNVDRVDAVLASLDPVAAEQLGREVVANIASRSQFGVWGRLGRTIAMLGCASPGTASYAGRRAVIAAMTRAMIAQLGELPPHSDAFELHVEALLEGMVNTIEASGLVTAVNQWECMVAVIGDLYTAAGLDGYALDEAAIKTKSERAEAAILERQRIEGWFPPDQSKTDALQRFLRCLPARSVWPRDQIARSIGDEIATACQRESGSPAALTTLAARMHLILTLPGPLMVSALTTPWNRLVESPSEIIVDHVITASCLNRDVMRLLVDHPSLLAVTLQRLAVRRPEQPLIADLASRVWATQRSLNPGGGRRERWETDQLALESNEPWLWGIEDLARDGPNYAPLCLLAGPALVAFARARSAQGNSVPIERIRGLAYALRQELDVNPTDVLRRLALSVATAADTLAQDELSAEIRDRGVV